MPPPTPPASLWFITASSAGAETMSVDARFFCLSLTDMVCRPRGDIRFDPKRTISEALCAERGVVCMGARLALWAFFLFCTPAAPAHPLRSVF